MLRIIIFGQVSGVGGKDFERLESNLVAAFGYEKLSNLIGLKSLGLLEKNGFPFRKRDEKTGVFSYPSNLVELAYKVCTPGWRVIGNEL